MENHWRWPADGEIYQMRTQQARHTRQTALAQDPAISPLTLQRDLNHTSRDAQMIYQHHLKGENAKLREQIAQHQLHGSRYILAGTMSGAGGTRYTPCISPWSHHLYRCPLALAYREQPAVRTTESCVLWPVRLPSGSGRVSRIS